MVIITRKRAGKHMVYRYFKRAFDVAASAAGLLLLLPFYPAVALLIRLDSPGPALFTQWRVGKNHRMFKVYKLRTMYADARPRLYDSKEVFLSRENDPRVTRVGRFLRKYSIDELPQLFNVLKGEMSLVGPRPLVMEETRRLPAAGLLRLTVRPGLTGFAQVEVREGSLIARLSRDLYYVDHVSFKNDVRILLATVTGGGKEKAAPKKRRRHFERPQEKERQEKEP